LVGDRKSGTGRHALEAVVLFRFFCFSAEGIWCMTIVTVKQLAEAVQVGPPTIRRWVKEDLIPVIRPTSRTLRFHLEAVMEALKAPSTKEPAE
jgi:excisionase family DNA binding protein